MQSRTPTRLQRMLLQRMLASGGRWTPAIGWSMDTPGYTRQMLRSGVRYRWITQSVHGADEWMLTSLGRELAQQEKEPIR
jgi:hypothetical protein